MLPTNSLIAFPVSLVEMLLLVSNPPPTDPHIYRPLSNAHNKARIENKPWGSKHSPSQFANQEWARCSPRSRNIKMTNTSAWKHLIISLSNHSKSSASWWTPCSLSWRNTYREMRNMAWSSQICTSNVKLDQSQMTKDYHGQQKTSNVRVKWVAHPQLGSPM